MGAVALYSQTLTEGSFITNIFGYLQVFDEELHALEEVIRCLATAGVDALIVQVGPYRLQVQGLYPWSERLSAGGQQHTI
jgi:hypothetical protein